ncbi:MAG: DEAD/DEAH box helicase family protein [Acetatifactor sp.]|nr:DEAD/DEAH box helicase family protein [Acetatifactor sp.]
MARTEKETREQLIDPKLTQSGWDVLTDKNVIEKNKACIETPVTGMPIIGNSSGNGFVDYTLFGDDGKPLAVIEAKKSVINEEQGRVQACLYADCLERQYGVRPVIYYTNGYSIRIIDGVYPSRVVFGFHKKDELEYLIQRRNKPIVDSEPNTNICNRYYQKDAIREVLKHLGNKHSRSLIVLATGTGKTRVSCAISDIFIRNNFAKRILFLADRKNLVTQAKEETFEKFLPTIPMATIIEGKIAGSKEARIIFSTYQSMLSMIKDTSTCPYGIGHFDLIIVDEAHRSLFNKYAEIFDYFDALMIGLTATPRNDIHKSTYKVFDLDNEEPNYEYDLVKAVKDGFLTYFRALDRTPDILKNGLTYEDLSEEDKEQYEELFTEDDGTIPEKIEGKQFYSYITNIDTIREVLRDVMEEGIKVDGGDVLGKTIIFARDHNHAIMIQDEFRKMYPELCNPHGANGVDYCVVIDNKIKYNDVLQKEFKYKQGIRIVVSVDMMDTGVDIPEVVNLVFFKRIMSKTKFWQMIGRGTRLCDDANVVSPSKPYFERLTNDKNRQHYRSKQGFLIFDVCNVFPFFRENPDGREDKSDAVLSLNQKIFMEKVALLKAMQTNQGQLNPEEKEYQKKLLNSLLFEVQSLNPNYVGVQKNLKHVEKYSITESWESLSQQSFIEIKKHIAPNISGLIDLESARFFDLLCYKFAATKFHKNNTFTTTAKSIYAIASYLLNNKMHISDVEAHRETLEYVVTDEFLTDTTVTHMDDIRIDLRELMRYIEKIIIDPIISDFDDRIDKTNDAEDEPVDFTVTVDDFKLFSEKVEFYITNHPNDALVYQVTHFEKTSDDAISAFKHEVEGLAKDQDDYNALFTCDADIPVFIRKTVGISKAAMDSFVELDTNRSYNERQIAYIKELLNFISQNGKFERSDLLREELYFGDLFNSVAINTVLEEIEKRL